MQRCAIFLLDTLAKSVKCRLPGQKVGNLKPGRVKLMTLKIDTYCYLTWCSAFIRIRQGIRRMRLSGKVGYGAGVPLGQHYVVHHQKCPPRYDLRCQPDMKPQHTFFVWGIYQVSIMIDCLVKTVLNN